MTDSLQQIIAEMRRWAPCFRPSETLATNIFDWADRLQALQSPWVKVSDRLPENGINVLGYRSRYSIFEIVYCENGVWRYGNDEASRIAPTYWQPLQAPEETK